MVAFGHTALGAAIGLASYHYFSTNTPLPLGLAETATIGMRDLWQVTLVFVALYFLFIY